MVRLRRSNWFRWSSAFSLGVLVVTLAWASTAIPAEPRFPPITGQWEGMYRYDDVKRFQVLVPFTVELRAVGRFTITTGMWSITPVLWIARRRSCLALGV